MRDLAQIKAINIVTSSTCRDKQVKANCDVWADKYRAGHITLATYLSQVQYEMASL